MLSLKQDLLISLSQGPNNLFKDYGFRVFLDNGNSFGFCTSEPWRKNNNYKNAMIEHYNKELSINLMNASQDILIRNDRFSEASNYLRMLRSDGLWNTLIIYRKYANFITGHYFVMQDSEDLKQKFATQQEVFVNLVSNLDRLVSHYISDIKGSKVLNKEVIKQLFAQNNLSKFHKLSSREKQCLMLLTKGKGYKEIGFALGVSSKMVEKHIKNIKEKSHLGTRSELIELALQNQKTYPIEIKEKYINDAYSI